MRELLLEQLFVKQLQKDQNRQNENSFVIGRGNRSNRFEMQETIHSQRNRRREDQAYDTRPNTAQKGFHACVFQEIFDERGNDQNDEEGGKNHAQCGAKRAQSTALG